MQVAEDGESVERVRGHARRARHGRETIRRRGEAAMSSLASKPPTTGAKRSACSRQRNLCSVVGALLNVIEGGGIVGEGTRRARECGASSAKQRVNG